VANDDRYCTNCRAVIPRGSDVCPSCGVYAGDVFDGKLPRQQRRRGGVWLFSLLVIAAAAGAIWFTTFREPARLPRLDTGPVRVVGDRPGGARRAPGAKSNEAEAIQMLRRALTTEKAIKTDCLVITSQGFGGGAYRMTAFDRCQNTRLGRWQVDGQTAKVSR
jgi:hypothetical protein